MVKAERKSQMESHRITGGQTLAGRELRLGAPSPGRGSQGRGLVLGRALLRQVPGHNVLEDGTHRYRGLSAATPQRSLKCYD